MDICTIILYATVSCHTKDANYDGQHI